jgi:hypothetical protein
VAALGADRLETESGEHTFHERPEVLDPVQLWGAVRKDLPDMQAAD